MAPVRRSADRRDRGAHWMALAGGGAQPGGGALRGRVPRARGEPALVRAAGRTRGHASRAHHRRRRCLYRACCGGLPTRLVVLRAVRSTGRDPPS